MSVTLNWVNPNIGTTAIYIYRDTSTIDEASLPTPLATLSADAEEYEDTTVADNTKYYYRIGMDVSGDTVVSDELTVYTDPNLVIEEGMWLCGAAVTGGQPAIRYNYADTGQPTYGVLFGETSTFGVFGYDYSSGSADTGDFSGTIAKFDTSYIFEIFVKTGPDSSYDCECTLTLLDSSDATIAVIEFTNDQTDGGISVYYGTDSGSLTQASSVYKRDYPIRAFGLLRFSDSSLSFEAYSDALDDTNIDYIDDFSLDVDLTTVTQMQFTGCSVTNSLSLNQNLMFFRMLPIQRAIEFAITEDETNSQVTLDWDEVSASVDSVVVYRDTDKISTSDLPDPITTLSGAVETYLDTVPSTLSNYYYLLDVQDFNGSSFTKQLLTDFDTSLDPNLILWYTFENISGTTVTDDAGNYDGTLSTSSVITATGGYGSTQALDFTGYLTDYFDTTYTGVSGSNARSFCCWVKLTAAGNIFAYGVNSAGQRWSLG